MSSKLNWLMTNTLPGSILLQPWLTDNNISYSLARKYALNGWLVKLHSGVYYRPSINDDMQPDWTDLLDALDKQLNLSIHLAGVSSLVYQGLSHYLQLDTKQVWLGIKNKHSLPKWFHEISVQDWFYCGNYKLESLNPEDFRYFTIKGKKLKLSTPELAAYEVVDAIGKGITFEHVAELFQGLVNLSPKKVQSLLQRSQSVQTNRIFLFLSHYYKHQWIKRIDETLIELGVGKRQVVKNGRYDNRYKITVPENFITE